MSNVTPLRTVGGIEPPRNLEAESGLLGAIILNNAAHDKVWRFLKPKHFSDPANGMIFQAMTDLLDQGTPVDPVTLKGFCERDDVMLEIGGLAYIARLAASAAEPRRAEQYGRLILECHQRRVIIAACERAALRARSTVELDFINEELADALREEETAAGGPRMIGDPITELVESADRAQKGQETAIATGYLDLDRLLSGGLEPEQLVILAARPGMGKSALALGIAERIAKRGGVVQYSSLEMRDAELTRRVLASRLGISPSAIKSPSKSDGTLISRMVGAGNDISKLRIVIDDTPRQSASHLRGTARTIKARYKRLDLIVVDHIGRMKASPDAERQGRYEKMTDISASLKELAKDCGCPVLGLCQLSRSIESRDDKRPVLSDLRDSGAIEEDADVVIFIYRESYYTDKKASSATLAGLRERAAQGTAGDDGRNVAEISVAKQRDGACARVDLHFDESRVRFDNLVRGR